MPGGAVLALERIGVVGTAVTAYLDGITDIEIVTVGGQVRLVTVSRGVPGLAAFSLAEGAGLQMTGDSSLSPALSATAEPSLTFVATSAGNALLTTGLATLAPYSSWLTVSGTFASPGYWDDPAAAGIHLDVAVVVQTGGAQYLFASRYDAAGLWGFGISASGTNVAIDSLPPVSGVPAARISDMDVLTGAGGPWLVAALADQDRLVAYAIHPDGTTGAQQSIGAPDGLGISVPTALATVQLGQVDYLVLASSQSATLSVFTIDQTGTLVATDNIVDSLFTRFASASQVAAVATHGRAFVVAAGSDDGLSLFTILPGGRLLLLATFADNAAMALANVSALTLAVTGEELHIVVASASEPGLTQLVFDLSAIGSTLSAGAGNAVLTGEVLDDMIIGGNGNDALSGGGGDDILVDGRGEDSLAGGTGSDIFVFFADGQRDVVLDFTPRVDRLDLSAFDLLYSVTQLTITPTAWGAILEYEGEIIDVHSVDGQTLLPGDFSTLGILNLMRSPGETQVTSPRLFGTVNPDVITGGARNELIFGYGGADRLDGHGGQDIIYGGISEDWLNGGDGADLLYGDAGFDTLYGGAGEDVLFGGAQADILYGGTESDTLHGEDGVDRLLGEDGDDVLDGGAGDDGLFGGTGNDLLCGGTEADVLWGEDDDDQLYGNAGFDTLYGGSGNDTLSGDQQADNLFGGTDDDLLMGGSGFDRLFGEFGNDTLNGGGDADALYAGAQDDVLFGDSGDDRLYGQGGFDRLDGGEGNDTLWGGYNADCFVFSGNFGHDTIEDFEVSNAFEVIDLSGLGMSGFTELFDNYLSEINGSAVINFSASQSILISGVSVASLSADDFVF